MRKAFLLLGACVVLAGCGSSEPADSEGTPDAGGETAVAADTASPRDTAVDDASLPTDAASDAAAPSDATASDAVIFPVEDTGPPGACGVPAGTTATASATGGANVPGNAIDGKTTTWWGSGGTGGTLRLAFPRTVRFDRARLLVRSGGFGTPTANFSFTGRTGLKGGMLIGTTKGTATSTGVWLAEASLTPGAWDGLDIAMSASAPCLVVEVFVYDSTAGCTPP